MSCRCCSFVPLSVLSVVFFTQKKHREIKNIQHVCIIWTYLSERLCVFFCNPSLYIYFLISYHTFFSIARAFVHEEHRRNSLPASRSRLLNQRWTLILMLDTHPFYSIEHFHSSLSKQLCFFDAIHFFVVIVAADASCCCKREMDLLTHSAFSRVTSTIQEREKKLCPI